MSFISKSLFNYFDFFKNNLLLISLFPHHKCLRGRKASLWKSGSWTATLTFCLSLSNPFQSFKVILELWLSLVSLKIIFWNANICSACFRTQGSNEGMNFKKFYVHHPLLLRVFSLVWVLKRTGSNCYGRRFHIKTFAVLSSCLSTSQGSHSFALSWGDSRVPLEVTQHHSAVGKKTALRDELAGPAALQEKLSVFIPCFIHFFFQSYSSTRWATVT